MQGNLEKFLNEYKVVEQTIRDKGQEVREWEEKNPSENAERLKVCRIIRNYIAHNKCDGFIKKIDNTTIKWLHNFAKEIKKNKEKKQKNKITLKKKSVKKTRRK